MASTSLFHPIPSLHHHTSPLHLLPLRTRYLRSQPNPPLHIRFDRHGLLHTLRYRSRGGFGDPSERGEEHGGEGGFDLAVSLFNEGDYHRCHDVLEDIWNASDEPARTLVHGILQCAVGFHHLFNQNHRGAMMELGEGLCKLRKLRFEDGPFLHFEKEISLALEFLYQTQKELAACTNDLCSTLDGSERSYQLLGSFAAGQKLYTVKSDTDGSSYIIFRANDHHNTDDVVRVKLPVLTATDKHLKSWNHP